MGEHTEDYFEEEPIQSQKPKKSNSKTPVLDNFSTDFTQLANEDKLDPVVGRDKEVKRISQILSRKKKNNAVIVGEAGVGKTALVEKLALLIKSGKCPSNLLDKRIVALELSSMVAGTKYRGQFEERIKAVIVELKENPDVILFIDELHTMVGAGNPSGGMDAANILKPALARGDIQCIGSTTLDEYKKSIEKDAALARRFQKVMLPESTYIETIEILQNIKGKYESFHNVKYADGVVEVITMLSNRYITDRHFPDKAIDILDELGSEKKISVKIPDSIEQMKIHIEELKQQKIAFVKNQDFEQAANKRDEEKKAIDALDKEKALWVKSQEDQPQMITVDDVYSIVTDMTGIPVSSLDIDETDKLLSMEKILSETVIGQDEAVSVISKAIRRNRVGIKDGNRPIGVFLCNGGTGTGKTLLAKTIAKTLFGSEDKVIRIDMSEYMEKHNVSKLIGSPPGYVGYDEGGQLTEKVKNNPFSVILFDEIEKAHKDVFNIMLQIMDEGRLTDSFGRTIDFRNTLIMMTSNLGSKAVADFGGGIGFETTKTKTEVMDERKKNLINKALKNQFAPEFLNRIDDIIVFNNLSDEVLISIIDLELSKLVARLFEKNYLITFDKTVKEKLLTMNSEENYGARPIKRNIQNLCEDFLSDEILRKNLKENKKTTVKVNKDGELVLV